MVEVSTDAGKTWQAATLEPRLSPYSWVIWNHEWQISISGEHVIMVRTTDGNGKTQSSKPGDLHAVTVETSIKL